MTALAQSAINLAAWSLPCRHTTRPESINFRTLPQVSRSFRSIALRLGFITILEGSLPLVVSANVPQRTSDKAGRNTPSNLVETQGIEPSKTKSLQEIPAAHCCPLNFAEVLIG